ncbi:hypothetical protein ABW19_dt0204414 [Dactylella cylindrospora]|nr:hypothetical protein ABW19_dt0204414 [Dactylella cylindrospora]
MSEFITRVQSNGDDALITPAPGAIQAGRGGGGVKVRSRICAYMSVDDLVSLSATRLDEVRCPPTASCAYSASYVGCVDLATWESTQDPVATTCIGSARWVSEHTGQYNLPKETLVCTNWNSPLCQTVHFLQAENTFTGFACLPSTTSIPLTATGGSWEAYAPTSIPTPIDGLYHIAAESTTTIAPTSTQTNGSAGSGASMLGMQATYEFAGLFVIAYFLFNLF